MKYRLKKDLPTVKAGKLFGWGLNNGENADILYAIEEPFSNPSFWDKNFNFGEFDKWFEEVREPREWYLTEYGGCNGYIGLVYDAKKSAERCGLKNCRIIRVREVEE